MALTQCIIFVNTSDIAVKLRHLLNRENLGAVLMFEEMDPEDQDEVMYRFIKG